MHVATVPDRTMLCVQMSIRPTQRMQISILVPLVGLVVVPNTAAALEFTTSPRLHMELSYDPEIPLHGIPPREAGA